MAICGCANTSRPSRSPGRSVLALRACRLCRGEASFRLGSLSGERTLPMTPRPDARSAFTCASGRRCTRRRGLRVRLPRPLSVSQHLRVFAGSQTARLSSCLYLDGPKRAGGAATKTGGGPPGRGTFHREPGHASEHRLACCFLILRRDGPSGRDWPKEPSRRARSQVVVAGARRGFRPDGDQPSPGLYSPPTR